MREMQNDMGVVKAQFEDQLTSLENRMTQEREQAVSEVV